MLLRDVTALVQLRGTFCIATCHRISMLLFWKESHVESFMLELAFRLIRGRLLPAPHVKLSTFVPSLF